MISSASLLCMGFVQTSPIDELYLEVTKPKLAIKINFVQISVKELSFNSKSMLLSDNKSIIQSMFSLKFSGSRPMNIFPGFPLCSTIPFSFI